MEGPLLFIIIGLGVCLFILIIAALAGGEEKPKATPNPQPIPPLEDPRDARIAALEGALREARRRAVLE